MFFCEIRPRSLFNPLLKNCLGKIFGYIDRIRRSTMLFLAFQFSTNVLNNTMLKI